MICPYCESPFTRIEANTECYTCHNCHRTFGHIVAGHRDCPRCGSPDTSEEDGYFRCNNDDCRFTVCVGYDLIDPETMAYSTEPACHQRFQYQVGEPVYCSNCHPIGSIDPPGIVACAFTSEPDETIQFPQNIIYPTRSVDEFFKRRAFDLT